MDWSTLIGSAVVAAVISGIVAVINVWFSSRTARAVHSERLSFEREQTERRVIADEKLAARRFEFDMQIAELKFKFDKELSERKFDLDALYPPECWSAPPATQSAAETHSSLRNGRQIFGGATIPIPLR